MLCGLNQAQISTLFQVESRNEEIQLIVKVENWERRMRWGGVERRAYEMGMGLSMTRCIVCTQYYNEIHFIKIMCY